MDWDTFSHEGWPDLYAQYNQCKDKLNTAEYSLELTEFLGFPQIEFPQDLLTLHDSV